MDIEKSIVYFEKNWFLVLPAIVGIFNAIIAFAKAMGWTQMADYCQRLENAIGAAVQAWISRPRQSQTLTASTPPVKKEDEGMKKLMVLLVGLMFCISAMLIATPAHAQEVSIADYSTPDAVSILDEMKKIPGMKQGIAYSVLDSKINYLSTIEIFQWAIFSGELGYAGDADATDYKLVGVVSTSLLNFKQLGVTVPILDLLDFRLGVYAGIGGINLGEGPAMRGNNEFDWGASLTAITIKF